MSKKKWLIRIGGVIIIGGILLALAVSTIEPRNNLTIVEEGLRSAASPLQHGLSTLSGNIKGFFSAFGETGALQEENIVLRQQIGELNNQINALKDAELENIRLKEMLAYKTETTERFDLTVAAIIAENNNKLEHTLTLDKGTNDGIASDMIVINHLGLVGRVSSVLADSCEVVLVLDREGAVGARVWETRETPGVVEGMGSDKNMLRMVHMPHDADICIGDTIVTSGLDGIYPPGIRIGEVVDIAVEAGGLTKQAAIEPYVNFSKLEEVFILTNVSESYLNTMTTPQEGQGETP